MIRWVGKGKCEPICWSAS